MANSEHFRKYRCRAASTLEKYRWRGASTSSTSGYFVNVFCDNRSEISKSEQSGANIGRFQPIPAARSQYCALPDRESTLILMFVGVFFRMRNIIHTPFLLGYLCLNTRAKRLHTPDESTPSPGETTPAKGPASLPSCG